MLCYIFCSYDVDRDAIKSSFNHMLRVSFLPSSFLVFDDDVDESLLNLKGWGKRKEEVESFSFRPLNAKETVKLKFYQNYIMTYPIKLYSVVEQKFVYFNIYFANSVG